MLPDVRNAGKLEKSDTVEDSFYELFIYEAVEHICSLYSDKLEIHKTLEEIGRDLGQKIIDHLITDVAEKFQTELDAIKYICKEFWGFAFQKPVDNLKTNNQGTFIIIDRHFKLIGRVANEDKDNQAYKDKIKCYECFVVGVVKGAVANLGLANPSVNSIVRDAELNLTITVNSP